MEQLSRLRRALPPEVSARAGTTDDLDAVLAVIQATELDELGAPLTTRTDIAGDWQRPTMVLATDVVVVEDGGTVVGYAEQFRGRAFAHVHPDVQGRGIGSALAAWSEDHARAHGLTQVGQTIATTADASLRMLQGRGYHRRWDSWVLRKTLDGTDRPPTLPPGITLRTLVRPDDDRALHELIDTAFADWDDRDTSMPFEDWRASTLDREGMDDSLVLLLAEGDALVGAALCMLEDDEGWIDQLAVARAHRGRGLGGALLRAAFHAFCDRGIDVAALSTDSRTGARTLYEHVGMEVTESFTRLTLHLDR